jgi:hypothetical protein
MNDIQMIFYFRKRFFHAFVLATVSCAMCLIPLRLHAQEERKIELTAQEILARVDRVLDYPEGIIRGRLVHILPTGQMNKVDFTGMVQGDDSLFTFSTAERGESFKVLYNFRGEDIWVYNILSTKLFHKSGIDKFDPISFTNFSFVDFSNADLQSNYTAKIIGEADVKGMAALRLRLDPVFRGGAYGMLTLYVGRKSYLPMRIDYHDSDKVIFKTLQYAQIIERKNRQVPVRCDMLDIRKGTLSILPLHSFEDNVRFEKKVFMHQELGLR